MKLLNNGIRILLGLAILFSGMNKFGHWLNASFMHDAMLFITDLVNIGAGFIIKFIALLEIVIGLALISNTFVAAASMLLLSLMVSIIIFHLALDLNGIVIATIVFAMDLYLIYMNKNKLLEAFK